jgi:hypothetical protein
MLETIRDHIKNYWNFVLKHTLCDGNACANPSKYDNFLIIVNKDKEKYQ